VEKNYGGLNLKVRFCNSTSINVAIAASQMQAKLPAQEKVNKLQITYFIVSHSVQQQCSKCPASAFIHAAESLAKRQNWSVNQILQQVIPYQCSWTLPRVSSLVPSVLHLSHGFQCSPTLNRQPYEGRLPLTNSWRKLSKMTIGSLISLAHHCYDWHPESRCG